MATESDEIQAEFAATQERWRQAIHAHRMAPPDAGFSGRLADLAKAARAEAAICRRADVSGLRMAAAQSTGRQPYELQPDTGRRGPEALWRRFDAAVHELNRAGAGTDLIEVARAHEELAEVAGELAVAVERQDRASGLLPRSRRERRTA